MHFIHARDKPRGSKTTYLNIMANIRPQKEDPYCIRFTVGGDRLDYPGPTATETAEIQTANLLFNSTISTKGGRFMCIDLKDFYLGTPMRSMHMNRPPLVKMALLNSRLAVWVSAVSVAVGPE